MSEQWTYEDDDNTDTAHYVRDAETGEVELIVPFDPDDDESFEAARQRAIKAAALLDLEAACGAMLAKLDYLTELWGQEGVTRSLQDQIRAAIAKAKGGVA